MLLNVLRIQNIIFFEYLICGFYDICKNATRRECREMPKNAVFLRFALLSSLPCTIPAQTAKTALNRKFQPSSEKYSTRTKTALYWYNCRTHKVSTHSSTSKQAVPTSSKNEDEPPCGATPKSQKTKTWPLFCSSQIPQKSICCPHFCAKISRFY